MKNNQYKKQRQTGTIRIGDVMFNVSGEEYAEYYAELERKKYISRQERGKKLSYEKALEDGLPIERLSSNPQVSLEEEAEKNLLIESMLRAIGQLDKSDRDLIHLLFFNDNSMREVSRKTGIPLMTLHDNRVRIFKKIRKLMGFRQ